MSRSVIVALALALSASASFAAKGEGKPAIDDIRTDVRDGALEASFRLVNGLDEETLERIHSGIPVTYKHRLELLGRRPFWLSSRRVEGRARIEMRVEYDPLVKRYTLWRRVAGDDDDRLPSTPEERVTSSEQEMRDFLTAIGPVRLVEPGRAMPPGRFKLKINSNLGRRYVMMIFPGSYTVSAERQIELDGTR